MNQGILGVIKEQYGALNTRMKGVVWSGIVALFYLVLDVMIIQPLMEEYSEVTQQIEQARAEAKMIGAQILELENQTGISTNLSIEEQIEQHKRLIEDLDFDIEKNASQFISPDEMPRFVERVLAETSNVQLVSMTKMPVKLIAKKQLDVATAKQAKAKRAEEKKYAIYRHGISFTLKGRYLNLVRYLEKLEAMPWQVNWDSVTMTSLDYPTSELTVSIYTLSLDSSWLRI